MLFDGSRKWVSKPPSRPGTWSVSSQYATAGLLLSSQTTNQEPTIRTVGLPELEMRMKINQPLRHKSATATTEKQQKETPILRWKNGPLFWVPYWKRNSAFRLGAFWSLGALGGLFPLEGYLKHRVQVAGFARHSLCLWWCLEAARVFGGGEGVWRWRRELFGALPVSSFFFLPVRRLL